MLFRELRGWGRGVQSSHEGKAAASLCHSTEGAAGGGGFSGLPALPGLLSTSVDFVLLVFTSNLHTNTQF